MHPKLTPLFLKRFWSRVDMSAGPDACWIWTGNLMANGYPRYGQTLAHRISYVIAFGPHPIDKPFTLHKCDFPPCVNPFHLFAGTKADNADDRVAKGREGIHVSLGEGNGLAKLTRSDVIEIRRRWGDGESQVDIAKSFGIRNTNVCQIVNRKTWAHLD